MNLSDSLHTARASAVKRIGALIGLLLILFLCFAAGFVIHDRLSENAAQEQQAAIARGRYDFSTGSCISCHALYPISSAGGAINLTHEGRRRTLAWLEHEIRFPTSIRPPTPAGQANDLAIFLKSLN